MYVCGDLVLSVDGEVNLIDSDCSCDCGCDCGLTMLCLRRTYQDFYKPESVRLETSRLNQKRDSFR